ncbi:hypothetical protein F5X97DRAFT_324988 [Nemania serpens]|nr:hypothetical protein F5X97DRAFT_324988 [Nemania serpens]
MVEQITSLGREEEAWEPDAFPAQPRPEKQYQCPQCPSSFKRPENLKRHQRGHDDHNRFTCQICDKSFSRSDILGRHAAIHDRRERQNENPQRRRACRECARVRERCSRGEPCRRCAIKALHCLYPDEPPSKPATSRTWCSPAPGSGDYDAAGLGWLGHQTLLESPSAAGDDALLLPAPFSPSQWQVEASYGLQSMPSAWPQRNGHSYQLSHHHHHHHHHHETPAASFFEFDAVAAPSDEGLYSGSASEIGLKDMRFLPSNAEPEVMMLGGVYEQQAADNITPADMALLCSNNKIAAQQQQQLISPSSAELQGQYDDIYRTPLPARRQQQQQLGIPFCAGDIHTSSSLGSTAHTPILGQLETLDCSGALESYENPAIDSAGYDDHETFCLQPPQALYPRPTDPGLYDFISEEFQEEFQEAGPTMI